MLLSKKIYYLFHIVKSQKKNKNFLIGSVFYSFEKKRFFFIIFLSMIKFFIKKKLNPSFFFSFKIKVASRVFFNMVFLKLYNIINIVNFHKLFSFSTLICKKRIYSVLRSPFVYKKSKTQLTQENFKGFFTVDLKEVNVFLLDFLEIG